MGYTDGMALITIREAAERLGISRQRMYKLIETYNLKTHRYSDNLTLLDDSELEKLKNRPRGRPKGKR